MLYRISLYFLALSMFTFHVNAQSKKQPSAKKILTHAKELLRVEEYHLALEALREGVQYYPENATMHFYLGEAYLNSKVEAKKKALPHLKIAQEAKYEDKKLNLLMGKAAQYNQHFKTALSYYNIYLRSLDTKEEKQREEVHRYIRQCKNGEFLKKMEQTVNIVNLGTLINSPSIETTPIISADENTLIFTSRRKGSKGDEDPLTGMSYEDIYISTKDEVGEWGMPQNLQEVNTDFHDACAGLSPDGKMIFIYKSDEFLTGDIYISEFDAGKWSKAEKLPEGINTAGMESHATMTADGKTLFFTSERDGGLGGMDIYAAHLLPDGSWATPYNLGSNINTMYDEESPFIHPSGKIIYFSSKGHSTIGGYDIFFSVFDEEKNEWGKAENIGLPINTADDDLDFCVSSDGMRGYFASIREESEGGPDIYKVDMPQAKEIQLIELVGQVRNQDGKGIASTIEVFNNNTNELIEQLTTDDTGRYTTYLKPNINYGLRCLEKGFLMSSKNIFVEEILDYLKYEHNFELKSVKDSEFEVLENIFFTEYSDLNSSSSKELEMLGKFSDLHSEYQIEIVLHTNASEDSLVNLFTSKAQADAIMKELKRLTPEDVTLGDGHGFGSRYKLPSIGGDGTNRIEYVLRERKEEMEAFDYDKLLDKRNPIVFDDGFVFELPEVGEEIKLNSYITFKFGGNEMSEESKRVLENVMLILERYEDIVIEVGGHTDNVGSEKYNMYLGQRRAQQIAQTMYLKGVDKSRVKVKSYGESTPIVSNDTAEGRNQNRRISFKLIYADHTASL